MNFLMDSQKLRSAGRTIDVPFQLQINCVDGISELVCTEVLRVLPGKRLVCFGEWNGRHVLVKFFLAPRSATRHCTREKRGVMALRKGGIKTPDLLFKGTLSPDNTPLVGFQRIMHAQNLAETWEQLADEDLRVTLLNQAVGVIADQHEAGIKQEDIHLGNFLITDKDVYTIDGDAVDAKLMGKPLPKRKSLKNVALFLAQFQPIYDDITLIAFQNYAKERGWQGTGPLRTRLIREIHRNRNVRKKEYLKKIFRECTPFVCRRSWNQYLVCDRNFYTEEIAGFIADPDAVVDSGKVLKDGNSATVSLVDLGGKHFVVKRYNIKSILHGLKRCIRPSRARISWRNAHRLSFILGIPTPKPIMLIENRCGPFRSTAYFISEYIEGSDLYNLLHSNGAKGISQAEIIALSGDLLRMLANASISHGDFKATNFIFSNRKLFVVDLDAMREHRFRWRFRRAFKRDLKRFMQNWADLPVIDKLVRDKMTDLVSTLLKQGGH